MPPSAVVQFDVAAFGYPKRPPVLSGLTLSVEPGEIVVLVGRSGAGKSTILKLVNRLILPTSGTVRVEGRDTRDWDAIRLRRRIGYVLQDVGLFPHMSVEENVGLVPRLERWAVDRTRARAHALLELVDLPPATFAAAPALGALRRPTPARRRGQGARRRPADSPDG